MITITRIIQLFIFLSMLILYIIVLLQFSKNKLTPKIKEKIVTEIIYKHHTASSTKHRDISKRNFTKLNIPTLNHIPANLK